MIGRGAQRRPSQSRYMPNLLRNGLSSWIVVSFPVKASTATESVLLSPLSGHHAIASSDVPRIHAVNMNAWEPHFAPMHSPQNKPRNKPS